LEKQLRYGERGTPSAATPSVAYGATSLRREALATFVAKVQPPSAFYALRGAEDFARICNTTRLTGGSLLSEEICGFFTPLGGVLLHAEDALG
jgi:hypothetical protein